MNLTAESSYSTPLSNSTLLPLLLLSLASQKHSPDGTDAFGREYDYIIVGAGAAGSVVASRLSEKPCVSVLLLEAGRKPPLLTEVPALGMFLLNSDVDWKYRTAPQKYAGGGYVNRELPWAAGKMIGGSSSVNSMIYVRGNRNNFDDWENMGASGWSYNDVFPYFQRLEDYRHPEFLFNGYHASGGPITVEQPRYAPEIKADLYEAATELGYDIVDSNAARQTGFYDHQASIRDNQRCSTAKAYLVPAEYRKNLDIVSGAMVTKICIQDGKAQGVQFDFEDKSYQVRARKEVIVSGGALNTPQILKLSGIGPADELRRLNISVVADLPVGKNFNSRAGLNYYFVVNCPIPPFEENTSNEDFIQEYIENRSGPLASTDGIFFTAFLKGLEVSPTVDYPNIGLTFQEAPIPLIKQSGLKPEVYRQVYGPYENRTLFSCTVSPLQPNSTGTVSLLSKNPYDPPVIDPNYLADQRDLDDFVQGLKACQRILDTEAFQKIGAMPLQTIIPGCEKYVNEEDDYFRCFARTMLYAFYHPTGTAKMGNPTDPTTVLDPELRVKHVHRLRVIDASVMPSITSGNTNIPTIMIAEKASDIIKETINCSH